MRKIVFKCLSLFVFVFVVLYSCKKDSNTDVDRTLVFESLIAEEDTIPFMGSTMITATADGDDIIYIWNYQDGSIDGSGAQVTYHASPCVAGDIDVSCTVKDKGNNELTKSVSIFVKL
jgi:hypothetical protein